LTLVDVNAAIKKHLQFGNMTIGIVTKNATTFKEALVHDAPSPISYKTPKSDEVLAKDKEIAAFPIGVKADNVWILPVSELFMK
jgi:zinc protease